MGWSGINRLWRGIINSLENAKLLRVNRVTVYKLNNPRTNLFQILAQVFFVFDPPVLCFFVDRLNDLRITWGKYFTSFLRYLYSFPFAVPNSNLGNSVGMKFLPSNLPVNLRTLFYEHSKYIQRGQSGQEVISPASNACRASAAAELRRFQAPFH